jgi:hypothetical protein
MSFLLQEPEGKSRVTSQMPEKWLGTGYEFKDESSEKLG